MILLRHLGGGVRVFALYTLRSGRWWVPLLAVIWALVAILAMTAKVIVPTAVYTLF